MTIATGVNKLLTYKKQAGLGVAAGATGGQNLRRTQSTLDYKKATYASKEIKPSQQVGDFRHGVVGAEGTISGELSVGTYQDFMESICRMDSATGATLVLGSGGVAAVNVVTFTEDNTGDTGKVGMVMANAGVNYLVSKLDATSTVIVRLDGASAAGFATTGGTLTEVGRHIFVPQGSHTRDYYTIEHNFTDIVQSERFTDCVITQMDIKLPASGMAGVDFMIKGLNMVTGTTGYFTTPTAVTSGSVLAAANGALTINGVPVALITGMNFSIKGGHTTIGGVVGSNVEPDIFPGTVTADGQVTVLFQDATVRDYFKNETEVSIVAAFTTSTAANSPFISVCFPRVKMGGAQKDDGEKGLVMTMPFTALEALPTQTGSFQTTVMIQDSGFVV